MMNVLTLPTISMTPIAQRIACIVLFIMSAPALADAFVIHGKRDAPIGFARLLDESEIEGCEYMRLPGQIAQINRKGNGVLVEGFALSQSGSNFRSYINVSLVRLSRVSAAQLNQMLTEGVGKKVEIVEYRCGAGGSILLLDEIIFK